MLPVDDIRKKLFIQRRSLFRQVAQTDWQLNNLLKACVACHLAYILCEPHREGAPHA